MKNNINKNKEYIVEIIDNGYEGEGIAKIEDFIVFIPGALKGEIIKILIVKVLSSHAFGKIIEIIKSSNSRQEVDCSTYKRCGGCNLRHVKYEETLKIKQNMVQNLVNKTLKNKIPVQETIGMEKPLHYRNKAIYPLGVDKEKKPIIGVFAKRTHEVVPTDRCFIQNPEAEQIAKFILEFIKTNKISIYNEQTGKGLFRHIVIKVGMKTDEIMCILVINEKDIPFEEILVKELIQNFPNIKTIIKNINMKKTNVVLGQTNINIYGNGYIYDLLGDFKFKISPLSFYQVNPVQAEKLYNLGVYLAEIKSDDIVFDLYSGIGTISIFMSKYAKKVYGIEIVEEATQMAEDNAKLNRVTNTKFIAGDVEVVLENLIYEEKIMPNIVMFDPPRKGLDKNSINNILKIKPNKIVYISCNPATLVRDLALLEEKYEIKKIVPVDMFAFTSHVECVVAMFLK